jgi:hypothetical protein
LRVGYGEAYDEAHPLVAGNHVRESALRADASGLAAESSR